MTSGFAAMRDRIIQCVAAAGLAALVSWSAWTTLELVSKPNEDQVIRLIEAYSPYGEDRKLITETLEDTKQTNKELKGAIDANTKMLIRLETVMETKRD